jgi:hypothetical protein
VAEFCATVAKKKEEKKRLTTCSHSLRAICLHGIYESISSLEQGRNYYVLQSKDCDERNEETYRPSESRTENNSPIYSRGHREARKDRGNEGDNDQDSSSCNVDAEDHRSLKINVGVCRLVVGSEQPFCLVLQTKPNTDVC